MSDPAICAKGGGGLVLPLFGDGEQDLPGGFRVVLYLLGLFWCFLGVAIIADVFMGAIEKVTSKKIRRWDKSTQKFYTYEVWNPTVANLTLMALGSSAPEILLNVIDIFAKEFFMEGLGPGTIVGSAAFNLLMIIAVCIVAIPDGEVRYIKEVPVYAVTASWSLFAYIWLIVILLITSPNVVEVWEGVLTFLFFPILTVMAFAADKGWLGGAPIQRNKCITEDMSLEELVEAQAKVRAEHGQHLSDEQVARFLQATATKPKSRAAYRVAATRGMTGGKRVKEGGFRHSVSRSLSFLGMSRKVQPVEEELEEKPTVKLEFQSTQYAVLESAVYVTLKVIRSGEKELKATVNYKTVDGTASEGKDYEKTEGTLVFEPGDVMQEIRVKVVDDDSFEEDESFFVELDSPELPGSSQKAELNHEKKRAEVIIIDDDDAGIISFEDDSLAITTTTEDQTVDIIVQRRCGSCGEVKAHYHTEGDSAIEGRDFDGVEGEVVFAGGQIMATISVDIKGIARYDQVDRFRLFLTDPEGGAKLDDKKDGGPDKNILTISLQASSGDKESVERVRSLLAAKWDKSKVGHANWGSQFKSALYVNGGDDDDGDCDPPGLTDKILHYISLPWKLLFALVPPTDYCGGWLCFYCALGMIGFVTMLIGDMASLLGCVMCLPDEITAITFVALGTSLPDTFASKTAATQDPYADASVGNVTGSNSVNVFLGLGLPWMIAAIVWQVQGKTTEWNSRYQFSTEDDLSFLGSVGNREAGFVVPAGNLAFSVIVFSICAIACIGLLAVRRKLYGGELGGPPGPKWASAVACVLLWFLYVGLSSWKCLDNQGGAKCNY